MNCFPAAGCPCSPGFSSFSGGAFLSNESVIIWTDQGTALIYRLPLNCVVGMGAFFIIFLSSFYHVFIIIGMGLFFFGFRFKRKKTIVLNERSRIKTKKQWKKRFFRFFLNLYTNNCITSYLHTSFYSRYLFEVNSEIVYPL